MPDVLPRLAGISKIVVLDENEVPVCCQACRFSDQDLFREWFCVTGKKIDHPRERSEWCPIMVQGTMEELMFTFSNLRRSEKKGKKIR